MQTAVSHQDLEEQPEELVIEYTKRALQSMKQHGVKSTPKNYAVWYIYVCQGNVDLMHEIDTMVREKIGFTPDMCDYLYTKYVAEMNSQIVQQTTLNMRQVMNEVMQAVHHFSGQTQGYHNELAEQIGNLPALGDDGVKGIAEQVMERMVGMVGSSDAFQKKLNDSRQEIEELKQTLAKVTTESEKDFLTSIYNRKALDKKLEGLMMQARIDRQPLCLLMLDVDHFKKFNDEHGHLIGDEVLKIVARALTDAVKGQDVVARFGGEEFAVLLPQTPIGGGMIVAEAIRRAIASKELKHKGTGKNYGQITVSLGVAMYRPEGDTIPTLIKRADEALYRSKNSGRNCVTQEVITAN